MKKQSDIVDFKKVPCGQQIIKRKEKENLHFNFTTLCYAVKVFEKLLI